MASLLFALLAQEAFAHSGQSLVVDPPVAKPGQVLGVHGAFLWTDETVVVSLVGADGSGIQLGETTTDGSGAMETSVTLPEATRPGTYRIRATASSGDTAEMELVVDPGQQLPVIAAVAGGIFLGVVLIVVSRLRASRPGHAA